MAGHENRISPPISSVPLPSHLAPLSLGTRPACRLDGPKLCPRCCPGRASVLGGGTGQRSGLRATRGRSREEGRSGPRLCRAWCPDSSADPYDTWARDPSPRDAGKCRQATAHGQGDPVPSRGPWSSHCWQGHFNTQRQTKRKQEEPFRAYGFHRRRVERRVRAGKEHRTATQTPVSVRFASDDSSPLHLSLNFPVRLPGRSHHPTPLMLKMLVES